MRVTNTQMSQLDDIIEKHELNLILFERQRTENDIRYKFKADFFEYIIQKSDDKIYNCILKSVGNKESVHYPFGWEEVIKNFDWWISGIKSEITADNQLNLRINSKKTKEFPQMIIKFSPRFNEIYNQAYSAEQAGLDELCGLGYRKSFEFLIKDYVIRKKPAEEVKTIKKMDIMPCINQYVNDDKVKALAHRVLWLGNDHAHYTKVWKNKSLEDLKRLIDIAIEWIDYHEQLIVIEQKMSKVEREMPKRAKR